MLRVQCCGGYVAVARLRWQYCGGNVGAAVTHQYDIIWSVKCFALKLLCVK